jgi:uncharacterized protein (DUF3820 family)
MPELTFGKYKNKEISQVWEENKSYCQWLYTQPMIKNHPEIYKFLDDNLKNKKDYYMTFGKYKNKPLSWIIENDSKYILYLKGNDYVKENLTKLYEIVNKLNI